MTVQVTAPHFVAGLIYRECNDMSRNAWKVFQAAPILSYMIGWGDYDVERYCERKGWTIEFLK